MTATFLVGMAVGYVVFSPSASSADKSVQEAVGLAEKEVKAGNLQQAKIFYINAVNHDPSDARPYVALEGMSGNATLAELDSLVSLLQSGLCRVAPGHIPTIQGLLQKTQDRLDAMLAGEQPVGKPLPAAESGVKKPEPVDLEKLLAGDGGVDYPEAIRRQKEYIRHAGDGDGEAALQTLQNLFLLEKVDAMLARPEFMELGAMDLSQADLTRPAPWLSECSDELVQLITQMLVSTASDLEQMLTANVQGLKQGGKLTQAIMGRMDKVRKLNDTWLTIHDARCYGAKFRDLKARVETSKDAVAHYQRPADVSQVDVGACTGHIKALERICTEVVKLQQEAKSDAAQRACSAVLDSVKPIAEEAMKRRRWGYNDWAVGKIRSAYEAVNRDAGVAKSQLDNELCWVDTTHLHPYVSEMYHEVVAKLMEKVDEGDRVYLKIRMAQKKKVTIEKF